MEVNEIIKSKREELGYSLRDLADIVGVNSSTIMRWENGDIANMRRDKIVKLADALRISPAVIMGWEYHEEEPMSEIDIVLQKIYDEIRTLSDDQLPELEQYVEFLQSRKAGD